MPNTPGTRFDARTLNFRLAALDTVRSMDLATRLRRELAEGKSPELLVSELVAEGMTESTARRLVDRAASQPDPVPPAVGAVAGEDASNSGRMSLIAGAFLASLGVAITAFTYIRARPGRNSSSPTAWRLAGI